MPSTLADTIYTYFQDNMGLDYEIELKENLYEIIRNNYREDIDEAKISKMINTIKNAWDNSSPEEKYNSLSEEKKLKIHLRTMDHLSQYNQKITTLEEKAKKGWRYYYSLKRNMTKKKEKKN